MSTFFFFIVDFGYLCKQQVDNCPFLLLKNRVKIDLIYFIIHTYMNTKKCEYCRTEIDSQAKVCPNCRKDIRGFSAKHPLITIFLALIIIWWAMQWLLDTMDVSPQKTNVNTIDNNSPEWKLNSNSWVAKMMCRNAIELQLKAPSTANYENQQVQYTWIIGKEWLVTWTVTSENSFWSNITSSYSCNLKYENNDYSIVEAKIL